MLWTRFKWTSKYFGNSTSSGSDITFNKVHVRKNFDHETWLNSVINIIYRRKDILYRFDISQPMVYSLTPRTKVVDLNADEVVFEQGHKNMWLSQAGIKLGFFVTTGFDNFKNIISGKHNRSF